MGIVIIPFDYERLPEAQRRLIVPICIISVDRHGNLIAPIWFEKGVAPIQDQLRNLARRRLGDVHRVSELAEITVHKLWDRHGADAGDTPWRRVLARAGWEARTLRAGDAQWRIQHTVPLALGALEHDLYRNGLTDPAGYERIYQRKLLIDLIKQRIEQAGRKDIHNIFRMLRQGYTWDEIASEFGDLRPETLKKRFWRWVRYNFEKN